MIYDQCMQQLLTFIMTVVGGSEDECVCGLDEGESIGDWDHWYADSKR